MATCLTLENLSWAAPGGRVLGKNLSLDLKRGQVLWIQGPNGSGKSTLIHTLLGDIQPAAGRLKNFIQAAQTGYLPQVQNRECHLPLTLGEVIELSGKNYGDAKGSPLVAPDRLSLAWNQASGGERQRTLLLREILRAPELLYLDEPFNHLDEPSKIMIRGFLMQLLHAPDAPAIVLVSHGGIGTETSLPNGGYHLQLTTEGSFSLKEISKLLSPGVDPDQVGSFETDSGETA